MDPIGQRLRRGREDKGASRVDVSQETKIAVHHLAALEYSDFNELPDAVHVKGYVRAYAEYLGLDPTSVLQQFLEEYETHSPTTVEDPRDEVVRKMSKMLGGSQADWSKRMRPLLIVGALALIALLVWVGWSRIGSSDGGAVETLAETETETPAPQQFVVIREPDTETPPPTRSVVASKPAEPDPTPPVVAPKQAEPDPTPPVVASTPVTPTPSPERTPEPAPAPTSGARLSITQYGVGSGVTNLRLRGESDRFATGTKVAFFTRVAGGRTGDTIRHVWRHEGNQIASIPLRIGSANWRTYSRKTMHAGSAGTWTVEALDEAGHVLARSEFSCLP